MPTAHEHYRNAERKLNRANSTPDPNLTRDYLLAAQVHATLALAAAHGADKPAASVQLGPGPTTAPAQGEEIDDQMGGEPEPAVCGYLATGQFCHDTPGHTGSHLDENGDRFVECDDPWCGRDSACSKHRCQKRDTDPLGEPMECIQFAGHPDDHVDSDGRHWS